ncbi:MAG: response regulator transcription factor [Aquabacterium sp.]|nr:MAG: response regulator transcription factor [Aquabacterium sp.]
MAADFFFSQTQQQTHRSGRRAASRHAMAIGEHTGRGNGYLIVDDHALIREGVVRVFSGTRPDAQLFEAGDLAQAISILIGPQGPSIDTVLLDLHLPDSRGIATLQRVRAMAPDVVVGVVSGTDDHELAMQCLQHGAAAFVPKHGEIDQFVQGISALAGGGVYFPRDLLWQAASRIKPDQACGSSGEVKVTRRQNDVLRLLLRGYSNHVISTELGISPETVKLHVSALLRAFGVNSRVHLILACANRP